MANANNAAKKQRTKSAKNQLANKRDNQMNNPLGSTPVLDNGWVRLVSMSPSGKELKIFTEQYRKSGVDTATLDLTNIIFEIKLPLLILVSMGRLKYTLHPVETLRHAWIPNVADLGCKNLETAQDIHESISMTIEAQISNIDMYTKDGCNSWVAKQTMPISSYATVMMYGNLLEWAEFCKKQGAPTAIKAYQDIIAGIISSEYIQWDQLLRK
jgi:hypothetical protein